MGSDDDASGKNKHVTRSRGLAALFLISLCVGLIVSERLYVQRRKGGTLASVAAAAQLVHLPHRKIAAGSDKPYTGPARNDLEVLLRRIAPTREVRLPNLCMQAGSGVPCMCAMHDAAHTSA